MSVLGSFMAQRAQRDVARLLEVRASRIAELEAENEKLKRQFDDLAAVAKRAIALLEQAFG